MIAAFSPMSSQESSRKQKTHENGKRRVSWDCWLVVVLLFFFAHLFRLRLPNRPAVWYASSGAQGERVRVCESVCVCECVCVFAQELARACALDHGMRGHVVCRCRKKTQ